MSKIPECGWREDNNGAWDADCGGKFELTAGTPHENKMRYCPYCGRMLKQRPPEDEPTVLARPVYSEFVDRPDSDSPVLAHEEPQGGGCAAPQSWKCLECGEQCYAYGDVERMQQRLATLDAQNESARNILASSLLARHPACEPLPDVQGVALQISNMLTGLVPKERAEEAEAKVQQLEAENAALREREQQLVEFVLRRGGEALAQAYGTSYQEPSNLAAVARDVLFIYDQRQQPKEPKPNHSDHVCGLTGYNPMIDPPCPACAADRTRWKQQKDSK